VSDFRKSGPARKSTADVYREVRRILWEEWDPIGVRQHGGPDDEYDSYAATLSRFVLDGSDEHRIAEHLTRLETDAMGLSYSDLERNRRVAQLLIALHPNHDT
jgi:hypothetical protein